MSACPFAWDVARQEWRTDIGGKLRCVKLTHSPFAGHLGPILLVPPSSTPEAEQISRLRQALTDLLETYEVDIPDTSEGPTVVYAIDLEAADRARALLAEMDNA